MTCLFSSFENNFVYDSHNIINNFQQNTSKCLSQSWLLFIGYSISWVDNSVCWSLITSKSNVINSSKYTYPYLANKLYHSQVVLKVSCFYMMKEYQGINHKSLEDFCCQLYSHHRHYVIECETPTAYWWSEDRVHSEDCWSEQHTPKEPSHLLERETCPYLLMHYV